MKPPKFEVVARWSVIISMANAGFVVLSSLFWAFGGGAWARHTLSPARALALQLVWVPPTVATMILTFTVAAWAQRRWREAAKQVEREADCD